MNADRRTIEAQARSNRFGFSRPMRPAISPSCYAKLTVVMLDTRQTLYNPHDIIAAYFPDAIMQAEIGVIGRKGMPWLSCLTDAERPYVMSMV